MIRSFARLPLIGAALIGLFGTETAAAQTRSQVISGRVTTDSGTAIPAADVIVTVAPTAETFTATSDSSGAYRVAIARGTGEYILYIGALGRKPFRQRVTMLDRDSVTVDARLAAAVARVAAVRVQAQKIRPTPSLGGDAGVGTDATDRTVDGVPGALPPDVRTNFDAMASLIPGLSVTPAGVSALGMSPDVNSNTLNGLAFGGNDLPRGASTTTRFRTSPWDPTVGGFSGVQVSTTIGSGGNLSHRHAFATVDAPMLQATDPVAAHLGQKFTNVAVDEGGTGPFLLDRLYYNFGIHVARQTASVASLGHLDPAALATYGVASDSAARLVQTLGALGVPLAGGSIPTARTTTTVSFLDRIDRAPHVVRAGVPGSTLALTTFGKYAETDGFTLAPPVAPGFAGKRTTGLLGAQGLYTRYFGREGDYVNETTSSLSMSTTHGSPYLDLPTGDVLVASQLANGATGIGSLDFGGNSTLDSRNSGWTWETINQTDFLAGGHESFPLKLYLQSRLDGFTQTPTVDRLGTFSYQSLSELEANQPASFTRTLNAPDVTGGQWLGAAALGGSWTRGTLSLTGGLRADANAFTSAPAYNPELDQLFGVRTDHAPSGVALSPRLGFSWKYTKSTGYSMMGSGGATMHKGLAQIRGGVGRFRGVLAPTLLSDAIATTGLPGGTQQLLCIGSSVPTPDWAAYAADPLSVPATCAGGASILADSARTAVLFDRHYQPAESWRANLGWTNSDVLGAYVAIDGIYSLNLHQPGVVDLNFAGTPQFELSNEGNRPVFVSPTSIVAGTGAVSPVEARVASQYGTVADRVSDLRGDTRQLQAYVIPNLPITGPAVILGYTYTDARSQARGFDYANGSDPRTIEWSRNPFMPRHQFMVQLARFFGAAKMGASVSFLAQSGLPYTPLVAGDINGDGYADDRAFIFAPSAAPNASVASGLESVVAAAPQAARDCLTSQYGRLAARNSCTGPWSATMNGNFSIYQVPHTDRAHVFLSFTNILGGFDELLHGSAGQHGWGLFPLPDPVLYQVRGFDQTTHNFIYQVNPRFGSSSLATTARRNPFRLTIDVQLDVGPSTDEQRVVQNLRVQAHLVGTRATADTIKYRLMRSGYDRYSDIYGAMLRQADSLALSRDQVEAFQQHQAALRAYADSAYGALATRLASLPRDFSSKTAVAEVSATGTAMWQRIDLEIPFLRQTLTPGQMRLLPTGLRGMIANPNPGNRAFFSF